MKRSKLLAAPPSSSAGPSIDGPEKISKNLVIKQALLADYVIQEKRTNQLRNTWNCSNTFSFLTMDEKCIRDDRGFLLKKEVLSNF